MAAILHDIGKALLARFLDAETLGLLRLAAQEEDLRSAEAEMEVLSLTHGEVGGLITRNWGVPEEICAIVQYHHDREHAPEELQDDVAILQVADACSKAAEGRPHTSGSGESEVDSALDRLGQPRTTLEDLEQSVGADLEHQIALCS